ncbi:tripartite tricarboxylate transporter substrate binding protein [Verminephrobacter eiseniae]|nr:tripartite tricarboxylate transporter substrate binding protein [Verminephrobacter eiseniae]
MEQAQSGVSAAKVFRRAAVWPTCVTAMWLVQAGPLGSVVPDAEDMYEMPEYRRNSYAIVYDGTVCRIKSSNMETTMAFWKWIGALALACAPVAHAADDYPGKPVKLLVGFNPGGATDLLARLYAAKLTQKFGQSFVVDNRAGAGGNIAVDIVAKAPADGYTLVMAANYIAVNAALKRNPYDWKRSLAPVALIASTPNLLVVPAASKLHSVDDLIKGAKQGNLTFGSPGVGSSIHMAGELFKVLTGVEMTHVPYRGIAQAEVDLMGGSLDLMFGSISTAAPLVESGRLRAIAVTGKKRTKFLPNIPTLDETGLHGFDVEATYLVVAPAHTPAQIVHRLSAAIAEITRQPDVQRAIERLYAQPLSGGAQETTAFLRAEEEKWEHVVKVTGVKAE